MRLDEILISDELWDDEFDQLGNEREHLRLLVQRVAALYESYRGGPFGVCQRTVRDVERSVFHAAQRAKSRYFDSEEMRSDG